MVREWGLSSEVGPIGYGPEGPSRDNPFASRPYAEQTQRAIDTEVARLLREAQATATQLLQQHREQLDRVIGLLLARETIDGTDLATVIGIPERLPATERAWTPRAVAMSPVAIAVVPLAERSDRFQARATPSAPVTS
jgi:cell division protease FtsH